MARTTIASVSARVDALDAKLDTILAALVAAPAKSAPAKGKPQTTVVTFHGRDDVLAGKGFPCTDKKPCSRTLKTVGRAHVHGIANGGHEPR